MDVMKPDDVKKPLKEGTEKCMKDHGERLCHPETKIKIRIRFKYTDKIFTLIETGDKVEGNNDPKCMTFMEVGQCVHDVFFDVSEKGNYMQVCVKFEII